jgi:outer membrane protein OmpA-like peptidoglycan-associated protein/uncharacterized surface protein with fasciclin (FAS1) repeats
VTLIRPLQTCESFVVMNARSAKPPSLRRYRRRILGWGAAGIATVFAIGGPIFVNRTEDDLERRAVVEIEAAGVQGEVTVSFSGQDGELQCKKGPVDIPDNVVESIRDLWGVSSLGVDASCTDVDAGGTDGSDGDAATTDAPLRINPAGSENDDDSDISSSTIAETTTPALDVVTAVVANDSQFSTLDGLLEDAGLTETLSGEGPFTLFAPINAAFEALGADITGALARDPELLATVLTHHVTEGSIASTNLSNGTIEMLDGTPVSVDLSDGVILVSGGSAAAVTEPDLGASNGVVHAIDQVLLPDGLVIGTDPAAVQAGAQFVDGQIILRGTVASETERAAMVAAAEAQIDAANVVDELVVDVDAATGASSIGALADVIAAMASNLIFGTAELTGEGITVRGVAADDADSFAAAISDIAGATVSTELAERVDADAAAAAALEADLNALVAANPILFDPNSASISTESAATLDRVAAIASRVGGVNIEIQGYTDTDGLADSNQAMSEGRAFSVSNALTERGIADITLTTVGFGGTQPILDAAGVEDKAASRRVEFVITATQ